MLGRTRRVPRTFSATILARATGRLGAGGSARVGVPSKRRADLSAHAALRAHTPPPARERRPASEARGDPGRASQQRAGHVCGRQAASAVACVPAARATRLNAHPPFAGGMPERAATRRRFFYSITEVQLLHALAAAMINNALAGVVRVLGVLASAPHLLRFGLAIVALAAEHLRMAFVAIALTSRRSTQNEENYPQRTWQDYKAKRDFRKHFRFDASHMPRLIAALDLPAVARSAGYAFTADEAISVLLFALATDATLVSINEKFGIKRSRASAIFRWTIQHLRDRWYKPLLVTDFHRWASEFDAWAKAILDKQGGDDGTSYTGIIAFIDGTLNPTSRPPSWLQRAFYSGYKKQHGLHYQGCLAPNGILIDMAGPIEGRHSDKWMLRISEICDHLRDALAWAVQHGMGSADWILGGIYFFTDAGYNRRMHLHTIFAKAAGQTLTRAQTRVNRRLSKARIANEWIFGRIGSLWPYVASKTNMVLGRGTPGCVFIVATLLTNALTCLEGNNTSKYFGVLPPSLERYFGDAPDEADCPAAWWEVTDNYDQTDA